MLGVNDSVVPANEFDEIATRIMTINHGVHPRLGKSDGDARLGIRIPN